MAHIYISQVRTDFFVPFGIELDYEKEFTEDDFIGKEDILSILLAEKYLIQNNDEKPLKPKGKGLYESGKPYPAGRFINNLGGEFKALVNTSSTWIASEWEATISVPKTYEARAYSLNERMLKDGIQQQANVATSATYVASEWNTI